MNDDIMPPVGDDSRILHELAGAASLCWSPRPVGVFDTQAAIGFVEAALKELRESAHTERDQLKARLDAIDAACLEVCRDNHESTVGDDVDTEMGRYVCIGESGAPVIDEDEPAEVVRRLSQVWERMQERLEKAEARVAELEVDAARLDWMETRPREHPAAGWVARESTTGRGYRLHTSVSREHETHDTVRAAIDAARANEKEAHE